MNLAWTTDSLKFKSSGNVSSKIKGTANNIITVSGTSESTRASIRNVAEPTDNTDAATKFYVDNNSGSGNAVLTTSVEQTKSGILNLSNSEEASSTTTGALRLTAGGLGVDGNGHFGGSVYATEYLTTSDVMRKKDISDIENPLNKIGMIKPAEYKLISDDSNRKIYGLLAQQLEESGLENTVVNGNHHKSVDYNSIIGLLVGAVNELKHEVEELKKSN
jgi:hypothetical protein